VALCGSTRKGVLRVAPKPKHIVDDAHAAISLVGDGFGVGWGPAWLVAEDIRNGRLVEVLKDWRVAEEPLWMVRTSSRQPPRRTLRTMQFLASLPTGWTV
jgi:DNA-binding transcriptional LysR family regulator